ncbi:iron-containing alcohol dehydrogenase [Metasolibacillus sp. FSL H7-0170]|uniref:iron-containing alcohol dehydrogenase n=1 Tax=Metasolibacillus sp. FSL H7-0170 TaxID=2921431 RepID=UPI003158C0AA
MKSYWQYKFSGNIFFGKEALNELEHIYKKYAQKKTLIITDQGIKASGILQKLEDKLISYAIPYEIYDEAKPEPTNLDVEEVLKSYSNKDIYVVIGLGGGSCIDLAKMVAFMLNTDQPLDTFYHHTIDFEVTPIIAIPTTAGTGSEVTGVAVVNDLDKHLKVGISSEKIKPQFAILDPLLTLGMPPRVTACSGIDALVHAIEAFTAKDYSNFAEDYVADFRGATMMSDLFAEKAIQLITGSLEEAVKNGQNYKARHDMLLGSLLAGLAFSNAGTSMAHAAAYAVAGRAPSPHGEITGLMMPYAIKYNFSSNLSKFIELHRICIKESKGLDKNVEIFNYFIDLLKKINLPTKLQEIGVLRDDLPAMAKETMGITRLMNINPRQMDEKDLLAVFEMAFD